MDGSVWFLGAIALVSFVLAFIGAAVGLILGHMRLPLLVVYMANVPAAAATSLVTSGVGALAGTVKHIRDGRVSWTCLALMGIPSMIGACIGAYLFSHHFSQTWSYVVIGIMLVVSGANLVRAGKRVEAAPVAVGRTRQIAIEVVIGLVLGVLASVTGLMLGSLRLPMMMRFLRLDPKIAVGSNMAIGCLTAMVGALTTFSTATAALPWDRMLMVLAVVVPPTIIGGYLGGWLTGYLSKNTVQTLAGWIVIITGVLMLGQVGSKMSGWELAPDNVTDSDDD